MDIFRDSQYNQGVGKYKVLSSNAGVGSIITTKLGFFVMPQSVSLWGFIQNVNKYITSHANDDDMASIAKSSGVDIIDDPRFISFLKLEQAINNLKCLVEVPHLNLNDWNCPQKDTHPLYIKYLNDVGSVLTDDHFVIPAFHFPRWFYSSKNGLFKEISEWKTLWKQKNCDDGNLKYFAPPRDPFYETLRYFKDNNKSYAVFEPLNQIPMLLICKNGHISDIPWYQLFCAGIDGKKHEITQDKGFPLFQYDCKECDSGGKHELQWIENRNQSESWGLLKCKKCGKNYSLEGIMNIKPLCPGDTPWNGLGTKSEILCKSIDGAPCAMQFVLATSNSVYYADSFSSLYIPICYMNENFLNVNLQKILELLNSKWFPKALDKDSTITKEKYVESLGIIVDNADNAGFSISQIEAQIIKSHFVQIKEEVKDEREQYKFEEFKVFSNNVSSIKNSNKLEFSDIDLPKKLQLYFKKIQQVPILAITSTQLGFNRVSIPTPKRINGEVIREQGQTIYNDETDGVYTLPANQVLGEGIFFEFNINSINRWSNMFFETFSIRYNKDPGELGKSLKDEIDEYGAPMFYLLHTFTHIILKELEFSCGYPTASLKERLFYSDRMCGVLIYTTDGAEGSMGGLVWQGQPRLILKIISSALERAKNCSSDPLCWEADQQLNLAACFSCCLVSETSCEQRNLGLDRRALVDEEFGFFRDLN